MNFRIKIFGKKFRVSEILLRIFIFISAIITCLAIVAIMIYIIANGVSKIDFKFLTTGYSESADGNKGILPMIINTFYVVILSMIISLPIGVASAVYLTQYSKSRFFNKLISFSSDILSGVPSIIFGVFGYAVFCSGFKLGTSILAGSIAMAISILPTVLRTAEDALNNVPVAYKEASIALGVSRLRTVFRIILPSALPEIVVATSLCIGKIVGESAILIYTLGMSYSMPKGVFSHIFESGRTLTLHLYQVAKQANSEDSLSITFATASILLIFIFILNLTVDFVLKKVFHKKS